MSKHTGMERDVLISHCDKRGQMGKERTDLLRGTLGLLILKALALEPLHGVGVSRRITQISCALKHKLAVTASLCFLPAGDATATATEFLPDLAKGGAAFRNIGVIGTRQERAEVF